jgi:SNF2 family DNA or RNA helicase
LKLHQYQQNAVTFLLSRLVDQKAKGAGLFLDPGLGKTGTTLSAIDALGFLGEVRKTLVVAPLRVVHNVWPNEIEKWGLPFSTSIIHGTPKQRQQALLANTDIYLTNPESIPWLFLQRRPKFDLLVVDESTKFKNWSSKRTKALRKLLKDIPRRIILTGTPSPNGLHDLFAQIFIVDDGEALGQTLTYFRSRYFTKGGFQAREWIERPNVSQSVEQAISPLVYRLKAEDHLDLPPLIYNDVWVDLPRPIFKAYKAIEKQLFAELENGETLTASSAGAKYALCRGIANGGAYQANELTGEREEVYVHDAKLEAVSEIVDELMGKPVIIAYQCNHDLHRLEKRYPKAPIIKGGVTQAEVLTTIEKWNKGELPVLLCQPQAMSHGLNLQAGGNDVIWVGLTDSLEVYDQLNRRLYRQGVRGAVRIHHVLANNTIDKAMIERIRTKGKKQDTLLDSLKRYQKGYALAA